jgi:hypothetical protein
MVAPYPVGGVTPGNPGAANPRGNLAFLQAEGSTEQRTPATGNETGRGTRSTRAPVADTRTQTTQQRGQQRDAGAQQPTNRRTGAAQYQRNNSGVQIETSARTGRVAGATPTRAADASATTSQSIEAAAKSRLAQADAELKQQLGSAYKAPATHADRARLAAQVASRLTGAKLEKFLATMEKIGADFGLNFGLSRIVSGAKVALNNGVFAKLDKEHQAVNVALAKNGFAAAATSGGTAAAATDDSAQASSTQANSLQAILTALKGKTQAEIATALKSFSSDGQNITKAELQSKLPALAAVWDKFAKGKDAVTIAELSQVLFKAANSVPDATTTAAADNTGAGNRTQESGTGAAATPTTSPSVADLLAYLKGKPLAEVESFVKSLSSDGQNVTKAELQSKFPALAAVWDQFAAGKDSVTVAELSKLLMESAARSGSASTDGSQPASATPTTTGAGDTPAAGTGVDEVATPTGDGVATETQQN